MSELKTLKDFEEDIKEYQDKYSIGDGFQAIEVCGRKLILLKELKAEAVKWYKVGGSKAKKEWIRMFFNLTEDDLE